MPIRAVAFDFDNTLADTLPMMCEVVNDLLASGNSTAPRCQVEDLLTESPLRFLRRTGGATANAREYWNGLRKCIPKIRLFQGVLQMLLSLNEKVPLGLQTSLPRAIVKSMMHSLGIDIVFREVIAYHDVPSPKPAPDGVRAIARGLELDPRTLLFVGDRAEDVFAAHGASALAGVALWSRGDHRDALAAQPFYRFTRPVEVLDAL